MSFLDERDLIRQSRDAREWLMHDQRGRVIGLILVSVAMSLAMSLIATMVVGLVSRRRGVVLDDGVAAESPDEMPADGEAVAGVPVIDVETSAVQGEAAVEA